MIGGGRARRPAAHREHFDKNAKRRKGMQDVPSASQKEKTDQNARHYNKRNNVGVVDAKVGHVVLEREGQFGNKMRGCPAPGGVGHFRVPEVARDAITFVKNGKRKALLSFCVKK